MNINFKLWNIGFIVLALGLSAPLAASGKTQHPVHYICFDCGAVEVNTTEPVHTLVSILHKNPAVSQVRIAWACVIFSDGLTGTILYSKRKNTLRYYLSGVSQRGFIRDHFLYSKVTAAVLEKLVKDYQGGWADAGFPQLSGYGCVKHNLGHNR